MEAQLRPIDTAAGGRLTHTVVGRCLAQCRRMLQPRRQHPSLVRVRFDLNTTSDPVDLRAAGHVVFLSPQATEGRENGAGLSHTIPPRRADERTRSNISAERDRTLMTRYRLARIGAALALAALAACNAPAPPQAATDKASPTAAPDGIDRTVLPIAQPAPQRYTELDARNAKPPARFEVKAPSQRAQRRDRADRRCRFRRPQYVRRSHPHADDGHAGAGRTALQQLPYDGVVLADP